MQLVHYPKKVSRKKKLYGCPTSEKCMKDILLNCSASLGSCVPPQSLFCSHSAVTGESTTPAKHFRLIWLLIFLNSALWDKRISPGYSVVLTMTACSVSSHLLYSCCYFFFTYLYSVRNYKYMGDFQFLFERGIP